MAANTLQDRRGVNIARNIAFLLVFLSFVCLYFNLSLVALILVVLAVVSGVTWESITRPPVNNPAAFLARAREMSPPRPVLVCLGDSLTHGRVSDDWTMKIPSRVAEKMKFDPPTKADFMDPIWVVNAGQNSITSFVILQERLQAALACYPDYIMVMIGSNDVLAMHSPSVSREKVHTFFLPEEPSMPVLKKNLTAIVDFITKASPKTELALCTLPPMGEDIGDSINKLVKQANEIVHDVVDTYNNKNPTTAGGSSKVTVLEVGERLQSEIMQRNKASKSAMSIAMMVPLALIMIPLRVFLGMSWKSMTGLSGGSILHDTLHLNEDGGDVIADIVVEWLFLKNVHKAIAVKQF